MMKGRIMSAHTIDYEWDAELVDRESGDIFEHNFSDTFEGMLRYINDPNIDVVLVRNVIKKDEGVIDRNWAYLDPDGNLPEYFSDSANEKTVKVPLRFHKELKKFKWKP